ncbi:hypothetical protein F4859DRAFT_494700 [Xylaria cf. heliscus]|nr:hypothetical protein F4859DRAFT_494700 [Xylaria cf. heliscus]
MDAAGVAVPLEAFLHQWNFFPWMRYLSLSVILFIADCASVFSVLRYFTGDTISSWFGHQYPAFPLNEKQDATTEALRTVVVNIYFYSWSMILIKPLVSASLWFQSGHTRKKYVILAVLSITQIGPAHRLHNLLFDIVNTVLPSFRVVGLNFQIWTHREIEPFLDAGVEPPRACVRMLYRRLVRAPGFWCVLSLASSVIEGLIQMAFIVFHNRSQHIPDNYEPVVRQSEDDTRTSLNFKDKSRGLDREEGPIARIYAEQERLRVTSPVAASRLLAVSF